MMVVLPARFARCRTCGRLITVDGRNPNGRCTRECGGSVKDKIVLPPHFESLRDTIKGLAEAHVCPSVESGDPADCGFGNVGCISAAHLPAALAVTDRHDEGSGK